MLKLEHIGYEVEGNKEILHDINLELNDRFVAITGPNGGGKSTLAKLIMGLEKVTAGELAAEAGITPEYLSTLFSEHLGCSIPQYIARQKVLEAKKLLRFTDKPLSEIAALLGYSSQSYFQAQFKKIRGITPAAYREKCRKGARGE